MLLLGTGISPDDRTRNIQLNTANKLATQKAEIFIRKTFNSTNVFLFNMGYMKQEYGVKNIHINSMQVLVFNFFLIGPVTFFILFNRIRLIGKPFDVSRLNC